MQNINSAESFFKAIYGKSCVVLAPSAYLKGRKSETNKLIQNFDIVVKTTNMCELEDPYSELYGQCDVWYGMPQNSHGWQLSIEKLVKQDVSFLRVQPNLERYSEVWQSYMENFSMRLNGYQLDCSFGDEVNYRKLVNEVEGIPFSGVFAISDLLACGASSVFAYGHDFYRSGYFTGRSTHLAVDGNWHQKSPQMEYLWGLLRSEPRFNCDSNLESILTHKYGTLEEKESSFKRLMIRELERLNLDGQVLMFRTINITDFNAMLEVLELCLRKENINIVCQENVLPYLNDGSVETFVYSSSDKFSHHELLKQFQFSQLKVKRMILPYNGQPIVEYYELIKFACEIEVFEVLLISKRGAVKVLRDLDSMVSKIEWYLKNQEVFFTAMTEVGRKECF